MQQIYNDKIALQDDNGIHALPTFHSVKRQTAPRQLLPISLPLYHSKWFSNKIPLYQWKLTSASNEYFQTIQEGYIKFDWRHSDYFDLQKRYKTSPKY